MKYGFKPKPVIRSARSRLANAVKIVTRNCGDIKTFVKTRTFALSFYICISMLLVAFAVINTKIVQVVDGGSARYVYTFRTNPVSILRQCGITLTPEDQYNFSSFKENFAKIDLYQAFPVKVSADNQTESVLIAQGTVSDVLKKAGITLGDYDEVSQPLDTSVAPGTNIVVSRVMYKTVTSYAAIQHQVSTQLSTLLKKNYQAVLVPGRDGQIMTTVKQKYVDGVLTTQETVSQTVLSEPVTRQILVGTAANTPFSKLVPPAGFLTLNPSGKPEKYRRVIHGIATGYSPVDGTRCSTGRTARPGYVAVNPKIIPYGTKLYIMSPNGSFVYGYAVAYDTGGFVSNGSGVDVDLFFSTLSEADRCGRRNVDIYVLS